MEAAELLHMIGDFERISDHAVNILESTEELRGKGIAFTQPAIEEMSKMFGAVDEIMDLALTAFIHGDISAAKEVEPLEQVIDELVRKIKARHIVRLKQGSCSIEYGFVLEDLLTSYERMADHCSNVAVALIEGAEGSFGTHEYLTFVKSGGNPQFDRFFQSFQNRYRFSDETKNKQT